MRTSYGDTQECMQNNWGLLKHLLRSGYLANQLAAWSSVIFEKLPVAQLLDISQRFYGTQRIITTLTRARQYPNLLL
jgi:hypothetical protein